MVILLATRPQHYVWSLLPRRLRGRSERLVDRFIETLRPLANLAPREASEKQIKYIKSMVEKAGMSESEACKLVEAEEYTQLQGGAGGTASNLITQLQKLTGGKKKKKGKSGKS